MAIRFCLCALACAFILYGCNNDNKESDVPATPDYRIVGRYQLGGDGGWDCVNVDSDARRVYIARSNRVMVLDANSGKLVGEIGDMKGVHGVAVAPEFNRGFVSSGRDNTVRVIDLKTLKETSSIATGKKPDVIIYDAPSKKVFAMCGGSNSATVIDAEAAKAVGEVDLGGAPEFAVSDGKGKVFVNLEDKNEVAVVDVASLKATAHWSLAPGAAPTGLSMDTEHRRLFSGCGESKTMVVMDADNGKVVASLPIGDHCDSTGFDSTSQNAFSSNGDGTLTVIHEDSPNSYSVIQNVKTQSGARTMAIDYKTHKIWLVTAEMKDAPDDKVEQNRQHKVVAPDTFTAITVGR